MLLQSLLGLIEFSHQVGGWVVFCHGQASFTTLCHLQIKTKLPKKIFVIDFNKVFAIQCWSKKIAEHSRPSNGNQFT